MAIKGMLKRLGFIWMIVSLVLAGSMLHATSGHAKEGSRTFPETGKTVIGTFLDYWETHGGLAQQGYPISDMIEENSDTDGKVYTVQYFERAVFELHPENQQPYDVLLSLLGTSAYKAKYPSGRTGTKVVQSATPSGSCVPTHDDSDVDSGAGFVPEAPERQSVGTGLVLTGRVLSSASCQTIAGAKLEMRPEVGGQHPDSQRATLHTDANGQYRFESDFPEHIHMRISAQGFNTIIANEYHTTPGKSQDSFDIVLSPDPSCMQFPETGHALCSTFLEYWQKQGGLPQQGYPISDEFQEKSDLDGKPYTVQYFERAVFEKHPENKQPYNVLLSQLGTFRYKALYEPQGYARSKELVYKVQGFDSVQSQTDITYKTADTTILKIDAYYPTDLKQGETRPAILFGGRRDVPQFIAWGKTFAASGFIGVVYDIRYPNGLPAEAFSDETDLIRYVHDNAASLHVDPDRLGIFSVSRSAIFGVRAGLSAGASHIRAIVDYYGALDNDDALVSPLSYLMKVQGNVPPVLIVKAGQDFQNVNDSIDRFLAAASAKKVEVEYLAQGEGRDGFDTFAINGLSQWIIMQTLAFLKDRLSGE